METFNQFAVPLLLSYVFGEFILISYSKDDDNFWRNTFIRSISIGILSYILLGYIRAWILGIGQIISSLIIRLRRSLFFNRSITGFIREQVNHIFIILLFSLAGFYSYQEPSLWMNIFGMEYYYVLLFFTGLFVSVFVGDEFVGYSLDPFIKEIKSAKRDLSKNSIETNTVLNEGFKNAGKIIGRIERSLIYLFVLVDQPAAIGFLLVVKAFRFNSIEKSMSRKEIEHIIIGTLLSFLFGLSISYIVKFVFKAI